MPIKKIKNNSGNLTNSENTSNNEKKINNKKKENNETDNKEIKKLSKKKF